uniref:Endo/exonuclease/phosphatase domain-containing protein n=1 Tax=Pristionchus pacificus TaxID=54126 RepID=A0A8R1UQX0_PRIPA
SLPYRKLRVITVYRSPSSPPESFTSFLEFISPLMSQQFPCILVGDFNYPNIDWPSLSSPTNEDIIDFACDHHLMQLVTFPTRLLRCLDLVFCNSAVVCNLSPSVPLSDHLSLIFDLCIPPPPSRLHSPSRMYRHANWNSINDHIFNHDWTVALNALDTNSAYEYFVRFVNNLLDAFVPLSKPTHHSRYPRTLKILYGKCATLVRLAPNSVQCITMTSRFNKAFLNYHCFVETQIVSSRNSKAFYTLCNDRIKSPKTTPSGLIDSKGTVLLTNDEKCLAFSSFFSSAFAVPQQSPLPLPSPSLIFDLSVISHADILCALRTLSPKINVSPDQIPSIVLAKCKFSIVSPLAIIFNKSLLTSQYHINNIPLIPPSDKKLFVKDLGVFFTPSLSFSEHINKFISKSRSKNRRTMIDLSFVHSILHKRTLLDTSSLLYLSPLSRPLRNSHNLRITLPFLPPSSHSTLLEPLLYGIHCPPPQYHLEVTPSAYSYRPNHPPSSLIPKLNHGSIFDLYPPPPHSPTLAAARTESTTSTDIRLWSTLSHLYVHYSDGINNE